MTQHVAFTVTEGGVFLLLGTKTYTLNNEHPAYQQVLRALHNREYNKIPGLLDINQAVKDFFLGGDPEFEVHDGIVHYKGRAYTEAVSEKILRMTRQGMAPAPLLNFLRKVRENPSATAQRELFLFVTANGFLIHEDGDIIAYKAVREDYGSVHVAPNGTYLDNSVGNIVEMPRNEVDDNRDVTCSNGLHFAAREYARGFTGGPRLMILKVNPKDVVSIPSDANNRKGRCCRYEVIAEIEEEYMKDTGLPEREVYTDEDFQDGKITVQPMTDWPAFGQMADTTDGLDPNDDWPSADEPDDEDDLLVYDDSTLSYDSDDEDDDPVDNEERALSSWLDDEDDRERWRF
jgi:hypothetical protein